MKEQHLSTKNRKMMTKGTTSLAPSSHSRARNALLGNDREPYTYRGDVSYAIGFSVLAEGFDVVPLRTSAKIGNMSFRGRRSFVGWMAGI